LGELGSTDPRISSRPLVAIKINACIEALLPESGKVREWVQGG
jgi:hypothetical protein